MQTMEEERSKLEAFCEEALKEALIQERRRYGFVLERQASLAKHYLSFFSKGSSSLAQKLDNWLKVSKSRESLPESIRTNLVENIKQHGEDECIYCSPQRPTEDTASISSQLRKTKSLEAGEMFKINYSYEKNHSTTSSGGGAQNQHQNNIEHHRHFQQDLPLTSAGSLSRAKSDTSLGMSNTCNGASAIYGTTSMVMMDNQTIRSGYRDCNEGPSAGAQENVHPKPLSVTSNRGFSENSEPPHVGYAKAVFAYLSTGDNQLMFLEGDLIALIGERNRGWQFGENIRTQKLGWFPVAYTEKAMLLADTKVPCTPVPPPIPPPIPSSAPIRNADNGNSKRVGGTTKSNLMIPTGCTNDSLHSSNDSGFSNEILQGTQIPPPPQPEVDYSDEEPQLSNSEVLKPGTKWLMDRYHMSESTRLNSSTRRRSLSSGNLSTIDQGTRNTIGNVSLHNGAGNNPRGPHHLATAFYDETAKSDGKDGPLKKFLNRTKSLIWRRPSNTGDQYSNGRGIDPHHHNLQPQRALESISVADTASELWGSHSSIVEMTEFEMKELSRHNKRHAHAEENERDNDDKYLKDKNDHREQLVATISTSDTETTPSLPPRNAEQYSHPHPKKQGRSTQTQTQLSPCFSSNFHTLSTPLKEAESCLVVSDHTRPKKCPHPQTDYGCLYWSSGPNKRSTKENDIDTMQSSQNRNKTCSRPLEMSSVGPCESKTTKSSTNSKGVSRVESFAVSEAPIIPESFRSNDIAKFVKRSIGSGSVAITSRTHTSVLEQSSHSQQKNVESFSDKSPRGRAGRRQLWENHANISDTSDNVDEPGIGDDDDEGTIDFNYNDEYDDDASSSVFIEAENDASNTKSLRAVLLKEPKGTLSKRSKSYDLKHSDNESRSNQNPSTKIHGVDTVDLPKRHGGFMKEKGKNPPTSVTKMQQNDSRSGSIRSNSIPQRNIQDQENFNPKSEASLTNPNLFKIKQKQELTYKGRPIGSPPPIPAPLPQQSKAHQESEMQIPLPPSAHHQFSSSKQESECSACEMTEAEPDYGTIKGSPTPPRKEIMKVVPFMGKHQSLIIREDGRKGHRGHWKGSIRSEIHTVELITTTRDVRGDKPVVDYGSYIHRRLYYPDRGSRLDQKSERSGNYCGPWYDVWGEDPSVSVG
ncbi:unnamed protein product [Orchesella dallaii]